MDYYLRLLYIHTLTKRDLVRPKQISKNKILFDYGWYIAITNKNNWGWGYVDEPGVWDYSGRLLGGWN